MNRPELFVKNVDILVDAYHKGKLITGEVCNCAVGNLIAYRKGTYNYEGQNWMRVVESIRNLELTRRKKELNPTELLPALKHDSGFSTKTLLETVEFGFEDIKETEYTSLEIEKIERAFESSKGNESDYDALPGLLRAIRVLGKIHNIPEETVECMREKVKNDTYKFSYKFRTNNNVTNSCPVVGKTK